MTFTYVHALIALIFGVLGFLAGSKYGALEAKVEAWEAKEKAEAKADFDAMVAKVQAAGDKVLKPSATVTVTPSATV